MKVKYVTLVYKLLIVFPSSRLQTWSVYKVGERTILKKVQLPVTLCPV